MIHITVGRIKSLILLAMGTLCFTACTSPYVTFTDTYFITNSTANEISLLMEHSVVWDTCAGDNPQRAWLDSTCVQIQAGKTIRVHPITREYKDKRGDYRLNVVPLIGSSTQLVSGIDTIGWQVKNPYMFTNDSVWSIYNTADWQTTEETDVPYTYYHTFVITAEQIERSKE